MLYTKKLQPKERDGEQNTCICNEKNNKGSQENKTQFFTKS